MICRTDKAYVLVLNTATGRYTARRITRVHKLDEVSSFKELGSHVSKENPTDWATANAAAAKANADLTYCRRGA